MIKLDDTRYADEDVCKTDICLPEGKDFPTVVYFHGGGLEAGDKAEGNLREIAEYAAARGIAFLSANYRMYPYAKFPQYIEDAANAVSFAVREIKNYGGNGDIFVSGQSAGAYLAMMLCFDKRYLMKNGVSPLQIKGWLIESAQQTVHFNVLRERGEDKRKERLDEAAPLWFVDGELLFTKLRLLCYDDDIVCRRKQNELLYESVLHFSPTADIGLKVLQGTHCRASAVKENGKYPFAEMLCDFVFGREI